MNTTPLHIVARLQAAIAVGWIDRSSRRARVAASIGGTSRELDSAMEWLKANG